MHLRRGLFLAFVFGLSWLVEPASAQQQKINICRGGKGDAKIKACTDLINRGGKDLEAYYFNRSDARLKNGDCDGAYEDAEKALSLKRDAYNLAQVGVTLYDCKNDFDRAIAILSEAIRADPKSSSYYYSRGSAYAKKADFELALKDLDQAARLNAKDPDIFFRRALLWSDQEEFDKAIADYDRAIALNSSMAAAYSYRGSAYAKKGDRVKAVADLDRALKIEPKNADLYENRAAFYRLSAEYERALADSDKAIALAPTSSSYMERAKIWLAKGDLDKALADADQAVKSEVGTIWSRFRRGVIYRYRGEYDRSISDFDELLRREPYDAETYVERGRTFEKKGDLARARADFERALKERGTGFKSAHADARAQLAALDAPAAPLAAKPASAPAAAVVAPSIPVVAKDQGRRVALVIGNGNYTHSAKLANPPRDANAVASSLRAVGFQSVTVANDLSREGLISALRSFSREAEKADWVMVYYAGHGIEVGGVNYLIPIDAKLESDRDTTFEAVSLEQVLSAVDSAKKIKVVVLDACRDNPFAAQMRRSLSTRSIGRGLARIEPEGATLVVYAAKHGQTALDGEGTNSPFAAALVKRMATPDVEINKIFRLIRDDVLDATAGRQEPFTYGSLPGREDFYFVGAK